MKIANAPTARFRFRRMAGRVLAKRAALVAAASVCGVAVLAPSVPASAGTGSAPRVFTAQEQAWVDAGIDGLLRSNPGSRRIDGDTMRTRDGVLVTLAPPSVQGCPGWWLCLSEHRNFEGGQIQFFNCGNVNLGYSGWNDRVSSIRNAQSAGVQSRFYNYDGSGDPDSSSNWNFVIALNSGHYLRDLSQDSSADGGNANDKIDIVHVC